MFYFVVSTPQFLPSSKGNNVDNLATSATNLTQPIIITVVPSLRWLNHYLMLLQYSLLLRDKKNDGAQDPSICRGPFSTGMYVDTTTMIHPWSHNSSKQLLYHNTSLLQGKESALSQYIISSPFLTYQDDIQVQECQSLAAILPSKLARGAKRQQLYTILPNNKLHTVNVLEYWCIAYMYILTAGSVDNVVYIPHIPFLVI